MFFFFVLTNTLGLLKAFCCFREEEEEEEEQFHFSLKDFKCVAVLGRGHFGKVQGSLCLLV